MKGCIFQWLSITNACFDFHFFTNGNAQILTNPMHFFLFYKKSVAVETGVVLALSRVNNIFFDVSFYDKQGFFCTANSKAFTLSFGKKMSPLVFSNNFTVLFCIGKLSACFIQIIFRVIAFCKN